MDAVEHPTALLVAVKAFRDVIAQVAAGLGEADGQCMRDRPARRGASTFVVAQEAYDVARGGEAQAQYLGLGTPVGELVEEARLGLAVGEPDGTLIDLRPGDLLGCILLAFAHG